MKTQDVYKWLITDDPAFNVNVDKIVQFVLHDFNDTPSLEEIKEREEKISFDIAYSVLQTSFKFLD